MKIEEQVNLAPYNSFGVQSQAAYFVEIKQPEQISPALDYALERNLPVKVLGGGSNILFVNDYPGLILHMNCLGIDALGEPHCVKVAAGENWHDLVTNCMNKGLHGLENLALIPGTVGAAPIQNIGAYGVELSEFVTAVEVFDRATGSNRSLSPEQCDFAYRDSLFKQAAGRELIVLSVNLRLSRDTATKVSYEALSAHLASRLGSSFTIDEQTHISTATPQQVYAAVCAVRQSKLPDPAQLGNAGSFFKNPSVSRSKFETLQQAFPEMPSFATEDKGFVKIPAAWMLDQLGWKGRNRGQAAVHDQHALVLVNRGGASGEDVYRLAQEMCSSVLAKFGIALTTEVQIV